MPRESIVILSDTAGQNNVTGDKFRGDGYFGLGDGNHTVAIYTNLFTGRVFIEGSLATDPTELDWFPIILELFPKTDYVEFLIKTDVEAWMFRGNLMWIRARQDRTYLSSPDAGSLGNIRKVLLNH